MKWFSPTTFGTWWSILSASANISGGASPFVAAYVILHFGWRTSVFISGIVSIVMALLSFVLVVNSPTDVGLVTFAKPPRKESISSKFANEIVQIVFKFELISLDKADIMTVLSSPFIWILCLCYMSVFCAKTSAVDWGQLYLMEDRRHTQYIGMCSANNRFYKLI